MSPDPRVTVLHVIESLGHGGAEQNLLSVLERLPRDRFRNHLAWLFPDHRLAERFKPLVDEMVPLDARHGPGLLSATAALARWVREHRPDLIHAQLLRAQLVARAVGFMTRRPVVTTWQNTAYDEHTVDEFGSRRRRAMIRWLDRASARWDRHFVAVSQHVADHYASHLGVSRDRITVIHNAVEPERYRATDPATVAATRTSLGLRPDERVLLSVGRLVALKGQIDLVHAMPTILRSEPRAVLLIAGAGPLHAELTAAIHSLTLGDRVRLLGSRRDIATLYQLAELFFFPSRSEGLSVALIEAAAAGLPAVVSDIPQNHEATDGMPGVRYIGIGEVDALAAAAIEILGRPVDRDALTRDRARLRERFSPDRLAGQLGDLFARVARA